MQGQDALASIDVGSRDLLVFQVLTTMHSRYKAVRTFRRVQKKPCQCSVQFFDTCGSRSGDELTVFPSGEPLTVDPRRLTVWRRFRRELELWDSEASERQGCIHLVRPQSAVPGLSLTSPSCPTLMVVEELTRQGWVRMDGSCVQRPWSSERPFSIKDASAKKYYFQCLLGLEGLFRSGLPQLPSNQPQSWYRLLLQGQVMPPGQGARVYDNVLKGEPEAIATRCSLSRVASHAWTGLTLDISRMYRPPAPMFIGWRGVLALSYP